MSEAQEFVEATRQERLKGMEGEPTDFSYLEIYQMLETYSKIQNQALEKIVAKQRHYLIDALQGNLDTEALREFLDQTNP